MTYKANIKVINTLNLGGGVTQKKPTPTLEKVRLG